MPEASDFSGRTILAVFAHPDDESLACGGTLARLADAGARVVVLCASKGEAGSITDPAPAPHRALRPLPTRPLQGAPAGPCGTRANGLQRPHPHLAWRTSGI